MASQNKPTILFLGATGGCALNVLTHTLLSGYQAVALVRSSKKLKDLLQGLQSVPSSIVSSNLHIVEGSITSTTDLKIALTAHQPEGTPVAPLIISGIGGKPELRASISTPVVIDQPTICEDMVKTLFTSLDEIYGSRTILESQKPTFVFISTTGITSRPAPDDVPLLLRPLYHYLLSSPHADKRNTERLLVDNPKARLRSTIIVRASLLMGTGAVSTEKGLKKIRTGTEMKPAVGYTIQRADVGRWIFTNVIDSMFAEGKRKACRWEGEKVTITS